MITQEEFDYLDELVGILLRRAAIDYNRDKTIDVAAPEFGKFVSVLKSRIGNPTDSDHNWLAGVLHCAEQESTRLRMEFRPEVVLGQSGGVFDVRMKNGAWIRVSVSQLAPTQAILRGEAPR